ncbi:uncharacterized protein TRUGW13939_00044 [Talaromyces rugulosus]|uniref:Uncharacterized protein n=1 Tax=Talaromyces rugulosus TaxID=121627 RepID=A0A7H8QIG4_TALRU|nr:uncharacterized protein TRUGW13939_00044 [Talaromyces rugulosus]QKX52973.1 hypothetical protein TRUGW13939_00044 [Talaromyces rugulosus]
MPTQLKYHDLSLPNPSRWMNSADTNCWITPATPFPTYQSTNILTRYSPTDSLGGHKKVANVHIIPEGESYTMSFENKSSHTLYLTMFYFQPSWDIGQVHSTTGNFEEISYSAYDRDIGDFVPELLNNLLSASPVIDRFKAFVTKQPTSFRSLVMEDINDRWDPVSISTSRATEHRLLQQLSVRNSIHPVAVPRDNSLPGPRRQLADLRDYEMHGSTR